MKPGAWLINTARGPIIDEIALYDALQSGHLGGAALDVFESEPYRPAVLDKDLRQLEQVVMTPHVGSSTVEACRRMAQCALANILHGLQRRYDQLNLLNPRVPAGLPHNTA
jgi:phosphoglycerate dehydrogenase-like enzyme